MSSSWDVAITAAATLSAGLGGALTAGRLAARLDSTRWRLDRQAKAAADVLRTWSSFYIGLARAARGGKSSIGPSDEWLGPLVSTEEWNHALETIALIGDPRLVDAALVLDSEMWRMHSRIAYLGELANDHWSDDIRPVFEARVHFVNVAREVLGTGHIVSATWGKPPPNDPSWAAEHWQQERAKILAEREAQRLAEAAAGDGSSSAGARPE